MRKEDGLSGIEKWEMEQLEAEIQALLRDPVPMDPNFKERLRTELMHEHRFLYGKPSTNRWRWSFGVATGTAAAALLLVLAGQFMQSEPPLRVDVDNGGKELVFEQPNQSPLTDTGSGAPQLTGEEPGGQKETNLAVASDDEGSTNSSGQDQGLLAHSAQDGTGGGREGANTSSSKDPVSPQRDGTGPAVALGPSTGSSGIDVGTVETRPVREFVFSSSTISMSEVVPFSADTLPINVELNVDESAFPAEKPVFAFDEQVPPDRQQRLAIAQNLGLGNDEQVTAKGYRYRGADGSTLLFTTDGVPAMEYVYRGELPESVGGATEEGGQSGPWIEQAQAFLRQLGVDVAGMHVELQAPSADSDKWIVTFIPELDGVPNLGEAITVHMKQGTVVEAHVPCLVRVHAKNRSVPLVPLSEALQRIVYSEEYLVHPDEKVVIREADLVYYAFENGTLAPAYQLRGEEKTSGKLIQMIVSAVVTDEAGN